MLQDCCRTSETAVARRSQSTDNGLWSPESSFMECSMLHGMNKHGTEHHHDRHNSVRSRGRQTASPFHDVGGRGQETLAGTGATIPSMTSNLRCAVPAVSNNALQRRDYRRSAPVENLCGGRGDCSGCRLLGVAHDDVEGAVYLRGVVLAVADVDGVGG